MGPCRRSSRRSTAISAVAYSVVLATLDCSRAFLTPSSRLHPPPTPAGDAREPAAHPLSMAAKPLMILRGQRGVPGQTSPVRGPDGAGPFGENNNDEEEEDDFNINVGRALDYLAFDVPLMFSAPPRLEIFTAGVVLKDPVGELCHGRRLYGALHTSLRVLGAVTAVRPRVGVTSLAFNKSRREVELKWTMTASAPFIGDNAVKLSAVSVYRVNDHGFIYEHSIDNRIKRDLWEYSHSWMGMLTGDRPPSA